MIVFFIVKEFVIDKKGSASYETVNCWFLVFLLCVNFPLVVSGQEISSLENQYTENVNYRIAPEDLFPFIYSEGEEFAWFRDNVIGSNSCIEGYLYVKNLTDGSITKILDDPVTMFRETLDSLFCITFDQKSGANGLCWFNASNTI